MEDGERHTRVVLPGTFTDAVKGLRELVGLLRDLGALVNDGASFVAGAHAQRQAHGAARNLDALIFPPDGTRRFLERIVAGDGCPEDIAGIEAKLEATAAAVVESAQELRQYRELVRTRCGGYAALKLDEIVSGRAGKDGLRQKLRSLVKAGKGHTRLPSELDGMSRDILREILVLNQNIVELHDFVLAAAKK
jgi:hypothetical protein